MKVLVINCGSSSLKYQLIDMTNESELAKGLVERIGMEGSILTHKPTNGDKVVIEQPMKVHTNAIKLVLDALVDEKHGVIKDMSEISAVGHRVLHAGEKYSEPVLIDESVIKVIEECCKLGPLHNPANLMGINACRELMPNTPMVAVFDTAFHQSMPDYAFMYAIPYELYKEHSIRRYGFHGTSHRYVSKVAAELLGSGKKGSKIITCHLGNGASVAAVKDGKCVDTSMGYTPLEGLIMGTRSGDIDPTVINILENELKLSSDEVNNLLNKKSGILGVSGVSSDFRDVENAAKEGNERAKLALEMFYYRVRKYIGSYAAALGGVDAVVFTAGLGENSKEARAEVCKGLEFLGIKIDSERNNVRGKQQLISTDDSTVKVFVIPTNEELVIARDSKEIVGRI